MKKIEITTLEQCTIERALIEKEVEVDERIRCYTDQLNTVIDTDEIKRVSALLKGRKEIKKDIKSILKKLL